MDLDYVKEKFGEEKIYELQIGSNKYINNATLKMQDSKLTLTKEGKLFADGIAADLFF
ncbi:MAG: hypothetical protein WDM71_04815 [Ferruginibacter sp.]